MPRQATTKPDSSTGTTGFEVSVPVRKDLANGSMSSNQSAAEKLVGGRSQRSLSRVPLKCIPKCNNLRIHGLETRKPEEVGKKCS